MSNFDDEYRIVVPALVAADERGLAQMTDEVAGQEELEAQAILRELGILEPERGLTIRACVEEERARIPRNELRRKGEMIEVRFALDGDEHGLICAKPYTTEAFDVFVMPRTTAAGHRPSDDGQRPRKSKSTGRMGGGEKDKLRVKIERVQVRSTHTPVKSPKGWRPHYVISFLHGADKHRYTADEIDYLAAYIAPLKLWYIIPYEEVSKATNLFFFPETPNSRGQYERFKERWDLLQT